MHFSVDEVINTYIFLCIVLLVFNLFYILISNIRKRKSEKYINYFVEMIKQQINLLEEGNKVEAKHIKYLNSKLRKIKRLIAYAKGLEEIREQGLNTAPYLYEINIVIEEIASYYTKRDNMEKAYFAYFISKNVFYLENEYYPIMEILITFLDNSTVYCRENVLNALYAMGNAQAVENALQRINDQQHFHHKKLLSDGLAKFRGDKEELAKLLWKHKDHWDDNIMIAVVQFITTCSDNFKETFFMALQEDNISEEMKLTILRYFRHNYYEPIRPLLLSYLDSSSVNENTKIVAASVLDQYQGEETIKALKDVLHHTNWYLRYNAAMSLKNIIAASDEVQDILLGSDRYAKEILAYMMDQ